MVDRLRISFFIDKLPAIGIGLIGVDRAFSLKIFIKAIFFYEVLNCPKVMRKWGFS
jgi:hypothetical protein